ncbi:MAG TPA: MFS transporter [Anaerolineaceae bacterium]|nr:MFS transporter [Anaerolineaceae bacterium]HQN03958.1 MFS transporter [Anaerolineaceae bacterium]HQP08806.1 MFS transporter [Anaerolineaceae bacterium]
MPPKKSNGYRWFVVAVFFVFMLLHQSDKLLISPLTPNIQKEFNLTNTQIGAFSTGALLVGALLYPVWGYLADRFSRAKLMALASAIWGSTTWLNAIAPNYTSFLITRSSTGIDDSSYPGMFSLVSDYFSPTMRGKVYGLMQLTQPLGYLIGMVVATLFGGTLGWRNLFYITGSLGIVVAILIFFGVKEAPRGKSEPELQDLEKIGVYKFDWKHVKGLFKKPSMILIYLQGFFGVFPWNVITFFFFLYLTNERMYDDQTKLIVMGLAIIVLAAGYPIGGFLGDALFKRTTSGRAIIGTIGVIMGAVFLFLALKTPVDNQTQFTVYMALAALFMPFASPNVISTVYDVTLPEVRSTSLAVESFIESGGAALAPLLTGIIADALSIEQAMLIICLSAWALCAVFFIVAAFLIPRDVAVLRQQMRERADYERAHQDDAPAAGAA